MEDEPRLMSAFIEMGEEGSCVHTEAMSERLRSWELEKMEAGRRIVVFRTLLPFILANRIMYSCEYRKTNSETGEIHAVQSSHNNEYFYEKYKE